MIGIFQAPLAVANHSAFTNRCAGLQFVRDFLLKNTEELVSVSHNWKPFVVKSELAEQFINWRNRFTEV